MQLDDHLKRLLRELGHAINDTVSESDRIAEAIAGVRAAGFDIVLKLDATIGLARRESQSTADHLKRPALPGVAAHPSGSGGPWKKRAARPEFEITPQDVRFLKSLKISFEDQG